MTEHFTDEIFKFFIKQLSTFSELELKQAILYLYDKRIQKEVDFYANDLAENIIRTTENQNSPKLDMDIVTHQLNNALIKVNGSLRRFHRH